MLQSPVRDDRTVIRDVQSGLESIELSARRLDNLIQRFEALAARERYPLQVLPDNPGDLEKLLQRITDLRLTGTCQ